MAPLTGLSFEEFVEFQFGHAIRAHGNAWYFDFDGDWWEPEPRTGVAHLTRLFANGPEALQWFSDAQIAQGLDGLINTAAVGDMPWMRDPSIPADERVKAWEAVATFFADTLAPRCSPSLGHLSEEGAPLNTRTYMWWDGFPGFVNPDDPVRDRINDAELACLASILKLDSAACQEGALHGLGHWVRREPRCGAIIDEFVASGRASRPELVNYAQSARSGCIL
ncbi:MAG: hypothetical protein HOP96_04825 [Sphingomonas sp.]|nr:hypothetical protein [Sphingomonas sp.]